jgi:hypothetical protein
MDTTDRYVAVSAVALDDLCELSGRAADRLQRESGDAALVGALRGAIAEVRLFSVPEP